MPSLLKPCLPRAAILLALLLLAAGRDQLSGQLADLPVPAAASADTGAGRRPNWPLPPQTAFAQSQLRYERVMTARVEARFALKQLFRERGIRYPAAQIFMRIFKRERELELWVRPGATGQFALLKTYHICALAGELGPKRRQGDEQVPEGFYYIDHFNPQSDYLLSLHLDYPNRSDALLGNAGDLGGDIFIHGGCNSAGCLALTDQAIKEVYWLSVEVRGAGQNRIPVHIFPARLTDAEMPRLGQAFAGKPQLLGFWQSLKPGFEYFERERRVPRMVVGGNGSYQLAGEDRFEGPAPLGTPLPGAPGPRPLGTPVNDGITSSPDRPTASPNLAPPQPRQTTGTPVAPVRPPGGV